MFAVQSKITEKVLGYFFLNMHARHYVNELARILLVDPGNLLRVLRKLEQEGVLAREQQGNLTYYFINTQYPLLAELKKMYAARYGVEQKLTHQLKNLSGLQEAYLYGSFVKKTFGPGSDLDVLLVGTHRALDARRALNALEKNLGREISVVDMAPQEFAKRKKNKDEFITTIFKEGVIRLK